LPPLQHPWLLETFESYDQEHLLATLEKSVIGSAEEKVLELRGRAVQQAPTSQNGSIYGLPRNSRWLISGFLTAKGTMPYVPSAILKMIKAG
jgi:hypothetical protein